MKMRKAIILTAICLMTAGAPALYAQDYVPTPVTVSKEKVKLSGKLYYSHVVLEKQTLFSISKAYGVTVDDLYAANPSLIDKGLQKNSILLIPIKNQDLLEEEASKTTSGGNVAVTPAPAQKEEVETPDYVEHIVKWYEDLNMIANKYGVSADDIVLYNRLPSKKVTRKQVLRIPLKPFDRSAYVTKEETAEVPTVVEEPEVEPKEEEIVTPPVQEEEKVEETIPEQVTFTSKQTVQAALLLPLGASGKVNDTNMDFYAGVLMAVKDMEEKGIGTELDVYDVSNGLPSKSSLQKCDFILGPIAALDIKKVYSLTDGKIPIISPLDPKAAPMADTLINVIQAPSPSEAQFSDLASWIQKDKNPEDVIIVLNEKGKASSAGEGMVRALMENGISHSTITYSLSEGTGIPSRLTQKMTKTGINRIIVASDRQEFMNDATRSAGIMVNKGYNVVLYAPSRARNFDIDPDAFHKTELHVVSSYFVDYSRKDVQKFLLAYRALYGTEPNQFAFQGYDTAMYFINIVSKYGGGWKYLLEGTTAKGLHTDFKFSGHKNTAVRRIVYGKDFRTVMVN